MDERDKQAAGREWAAAAQLVVDDFIRELQKVQPHQVEEWRVLMQKQLAEEVERRWKPRNGATPAKQGWSRFPFQFNQIAPRATLSRPERLRR